MLSVTFSQAIVIDAANLHSLLSLAGAPALVEPYLNGHAVAAVTRPGRKPRLVNADVNAPAPEAVDVAVEVTKGEVADKPKRTRATKAEMLARKDVAPPAQASAAETTAKPEAAAVADAPKKRGRKPAAEKAEGDAPKLKSTGKTITADAPDPAALLDRFAKLIDSDFAGAKAVLDGFGVNRFSDLKANQHAAFAAKLIELGV